MLLSGRLRGARGGAAAAAALVLTQAACSSGAERVPPACMDSSGAFVRALAAAPGPVSVDGTRISRCFARRSSSADVENVGAGLITVAEQLSSRAHVHPHSRSATELGYLIGASERGAARTEGIHYELLRRLQMELVGLNTRTPEYASGEAAGKRFG